MTTTRSFGLLIVSISCKSYTISIDDYMTLPDNFIPGLLKNKQVRFQVVY